ncbi:MAG: glycosyltransferase family 2 protein [Candidatus Sumerlaeota bacterium]|nr:glycosyltransferase family 2 protein [Candidatus Sumerlaeota bacterium]
MTILIPAFNEAEALKETLAALGLYQKYYREILVVDDGSSDATAQVAADNGARVIRHPTNRGYGAAVKTGCAAAMTRYVLMFDADGQHPADSIPDFTRDLGGSDIVIGQRVQGSDAQILRRPGKWILARVANHLTGQKIPDLNCGMRLVDREVIARYGGILPDGFSISTTLTIAALKDRLRVRWAPIKTHPRAGRPSSVRIVRDGMNTILLILRVIMLFDPLKIFLPVSGMIFLFGIADLIFEILYIHKVHLSSLSVTSFLTSALVFMSGLIADQLAALRRQLR